MHYHRSNFITRWVKRNQKPNGTFTAFKRQLVQTDSVNEILDPLIPWAAALKIICE